MIQIIVAMVLAAVLFAGFGAIGYRSCRGHCAGCTGTCGRHHGEAP
ncbi:MAG TPA: hypothetical protein VFU23_08240 [Gemmatimonadales bacterium]|nr:hypothetical protein [Gemmatimonadales bacterium]